MEIRYNVVNLNRREISDLLGRGVIEGPLDKTRIEERDTMLGTGYERCRKKAAGIARRNNTPIITQTFDAWYNGKAEVEFAFYRFKFDSIHSSS